MIAKPEVALDASVLPIVDEPFPKYDPDNPEPPSGALLPPAGLEQGVDAQPPPPELTAAREKVIRSIAKQIGYHGLDTAKIDADPAGVEKAVRTYLEALPEDRQDDRWVAQIVLGMIIRYRGDCEEGPKQAVGAAKSIDAAHPTYGDFRKLSKQMKRWYARAWMTNALCWLDDKARLDANAFAQALKSMSPALVILGDLPASAAERGEQQLATAIGMYEKGESDQAMHAWLEAAEKFGGSKVKKLAAKWRAAAGL